MKDTESFLPIINQPPEPSDRDTAIAGLAAGAAWLTWAIALTTTAITPPIVIAVWRALL